MPFAGDAHVCTNAVREHYHSFVIHTQGCYAWMLGALISLSLSLPLTHAHTSSTRGGAVKASVPPFPASECRKYTSQLLCTLLGSVFHASYISSTYRLRVASTDPIPESKPRKKQTRKEQHARERESSDRERERGKRRFFQVQFDMTSGSSNGSMRAHGIQKGYNTAHYHHHLMNQPTTHQPPLRSLHTPPSK